MTAPQDQPKHVVQPPPQDDETIQHIAELLLAGYALDRLVRLLAGLLRPFGVSAKAVRGAVGFNFVTGHKPNARLKAAGLNRRGPGAAIARKQSMNELFLRAAYVLNASKRIQADLDDDKPLHVALSDESVFYRAHDKARRQRQDAMAAVGKAAEDVGTETDDGTLLGWYIDPLLNNESECIAANGNNFYAEEGTVVGWPGTVHRNCGCAPGPAHEGGGMVNDAVAEHVVFGKPALLKLKRAS